MSSLPKIYLATDHAGFQYKEDVREWLVNEGYEIEDCGAYHYDSEDDFTDFISKAAMAVEEDPVNRRAVVFGGSGQGEAMMANRFYGVRATVYYGGPREIITLSRQHNNANVLSVGARFVSIDDAKSVIWEWLHTETNTQEKYHRRNDELDDLSHPFASKVDDFVSKLSSLLTREL